MSPSLLCPLVWPYVSLKRVVSCPRREPPPVSFLLFSLFHNSVSFLFLSFLFFSLFFPFSFPSRPFIVLLMLENRGTSPRPRESRQLNRVLRFSLLASRFILEYYLEYYLTSARFTWSLVKSIFYWTFVLPLYNVISSTFE